MYKYVPIFLVSVISFNTHIFPTNIIYTKDVGRIVTYYDTDENKSFISSNGVVENIPIDSQRKVLTLAKTFKVQDFKSPTDIGSITEDIKYNYHSTLEDSTIFLNSLLWKGWSIQNYEATDISIYIELTKDEDLLRLVIYKDYLKVYYKNNLFEEEE